MKKSLIIFLFLTLSAWAGELRVLGLGMSSEDPLSICQQNSISNIIEGLISLGIPSGLIKGLDLSPAQFTGIQLVHMEEDLLSNGIYMERSMHLAHSAGAKISLNLTKIDLIEQYRERIWALIETYTDILFVNEQEAYALTHLLPAEAATFLSNICPVVVIKTENLGCWVCSHKEHFHSICKAPSPLNSDVFTTAFLYCYLNGYSLKTCASFGNLAGSTTQLEGQLPATAWEDLKKRL